MDDLLTLIGRREALFDDDIARAEGTLTRAVRESSFLVIGAAGSVGQAVTREIFRRDPKRLDLVDLSENNLVELIRDLRSSLGYTRGEFQALPLDCGSTEFRAFLARQPDYDYILNLSALKHVRSEKDPFTLMRMISVNILNAVDLCAIAERQGCRKFFAVSTDKAVRPVNLMGATKSVMELFLMRAAEGVPVSTARFANVAFSDGSLLYGFEQRVRKRQPLSAPRDVRRYFITPRESGELCLMSAILGENRDIFFPKTGSELRLTSFPEIACRYLASLGYSPYLCESEEEARSRAEELIEDGRWPCWFFDSDTTGEKESEEFHTEDDPVDRERFRSIGVIRGRRDFDAAALKEFLESVRSLRAAGRWTKEELVELFLRVEGEFHHQETHRYLDSRM